MAIEKITDYRVRRVPKGRSKSFGRGLTLYHTPAGNRIWRLRYKTGDKWKIVTVGKYPDIPVDEVEKRAAELRNKIASGVSPTDEKREQKKREEEARRKREEEARHLREHNFKKGFERYLHQREGKISESHYRRLLKGFDDYCRPLHDLPMDQIGKEEIKEVLDPLVIAGKIETAKKLRHGLSHLFKIAEGWPRWGVEGNPALQASLGIDKDDVIVENYPALLEEEKIRELYRRICEYENTNRPHKPTAWALRVLMLLGVRPSVVRLAEWSWIDFDEKLMKVPRTVRGIKMRTSKAKSSKSPWETPLSDEVVEILRRAKEWRDRHRPGCRYVFPAYRSSCNPISDAGFNAALSRIWGDVEGEKIVAHGLRSSFSTVCQRHRLDLYIPIESQMGHVVHSKIKIIYDRRPNTEMEERAELLEWWSAWLRGVEDGR